MKKVVLILFLFLTSAAMAQSGEGGFFEDGKYWICEENNPITGHYRYFKMIVDRTVNFNGHEAKVLIRETIGKGPQKCEFAVGYEEDGCVYVSWENDTYLNKMLDFNVMPGDEIVKLDGGLVQPSNKDYSLIVEDVDYIYIDGYERKIIKLKDEYFSYLPFYWIEGIGATVSFGHITEIPYLLGGPEEEDEEYSYLTFERVVACYQDDKCLFTSDILEQYEAGNNNLSNINESPFINSQNDPESLYDLMGRKVTHPQPGHIYVSPSGKRLY